MRRQKPPKSPSKFQGRDQRGTDRFAGKPSGAGANRPARPSAKPDYDRHEQPHRHEKPQQSKPRQADKAPGKLPMESGTAWLYGRHAVFAALANPYREILRLVATAEAAARSDADIAKAHTVRGGTPHPLEVVDRQTLDTSLPRGAVHQGIAVLVTPLPEPDLAAIVPAEPAPALVVVLDQVTDPHNVGAIMRSSVAFGAHAVIVTERHAPEETGTLGKSASGALEHLPLLRVVNLVRTLEELKQAGFWIVGLAGEAEQTLADAKLTGRIALVLGAEGDGMRRLTREHCDLLVRLAIKADMPSLNVSNAAAVALYELARR